MFFSEDHQCCQEKKTCNLKVKTNIHIFYFQYHHLLEINPHIYAIKLQKQYMCIIKIFWNLNEEILSISSYYCQPCC